MKVLDAIVVQLDQRGKGIGTEMLRKVCAWADIEEEILILSADSTVVGRVEDPEADERLVQFYSRFGFRPSDVKDLYTDGITTSKNVMVREPERVPADVLLSIRDYRE